jgi:hypothetical protein
MGLSGRRFAVSVVAFIGVGVAVVILSRDDAMPAAAT